jgi:uncharacterized protein (DUF305 family)
MPRFLSLLLGSSLLAIAEVAPAQNVPIVQPGAPGQPVRALTPQEAVRIADTRFSPDDVRFMNDMIPHHAQATVMTALVRERTNRPAIVTAARRIDASQADEIAFMERWLRDRGQPTPRAGAAMSHHAGHGAGGGHEMRGMATPQQLASLAAARGPAFDRLFLRLMITHHEGAVQMANELLEQGGSAYDPTLFEFVNDVITEQKAEIKRMTELLGTIADDPRTSLKPGVRDAGQAIRGLQLVASLPRPTGFFDPANPGDLPLKKAVSKGKGPAAASSSGGGDSRSPLLSFAQTDLAFQGDLLAVGNYHGFNLYRMQASGTPQLISSVICPGGQGDLSVIGNLLVMSVEQRRGRIDCGRQGVSEDVSTERFRGLRIFDISNPAQPRQVGQVQTCRGSHTHSVVSGDGRTGSVIVYVSGTSGVRDERELAGCVGDVPGDPRTALFRIDVVEIPVADPSKARIIDSPRVFADTATGNVAGLWRGGDHGDGTQDTSRTDQCHDITVFPTRKLAAGACSGNGIILDIANPRKPRRIDAVVDPTFAYWHSATFNNDGTKVLFTDEWGGGSRARCRVQDPQNWGANAIYDIVDNRLRFRSHNKLPAAQGEMENCVAHNGSIIPVPGRDLFVQAWYQGGISVTDFTDSSRPREIAYFDRGPLSGQDLVLGGFWSAYWYRGRIYATEIVRGLDVLALTPGDQLSANEIAAASLADYGGRFNPQQQFPVNWPDHPLVALAYLDQLERSGSTTAPNTAALRSALAQARTHMDARSKDGALARNLATLASQLTVPASDAIATGRVSALRQTVAGIGTQLR